MTIIKWILFFVLAPFVYYQINILVSLPFSITVLPFVLATVFCDSQVSTLIAAGAFFVEPIIFAPFAMYLYAKIFGVFKYVDGLKINIWIKMFVVFLVSLVLFFFMYYPYRFFGARFTFEYSYYFSFTSFSLIQSFFIYKLLQHLTQKHPVPFKALAYYFSVELYKSVAKKLFNKLKSKSKRD